MSVRRSWTKNIMILIYKSVTESVLSFIFLFFFFFFFFFFGGGGGGSSKGDCIKADRIIKISEKFTTHVPHLDALYNKKTLDEIISAVSFFLISLIVLMDTVIL